MRIAALVILICLTLAPMNGFVGTSSANASKYVACPVSYVNQVTAVSCAYLTISAVNMICYNDSNYHCSFEVHLNLEVTGYRICGWAHSDATPTIAPYGSTIFSACVDEAGQTIPNVHDEGIYGPITSHRGGDETREETNLNVAGDTRTYRTRACSGPLPSAPGGTFCETKIFTVTFPPWQTASGSIEPGPMILPILALTMCNNGEDDDGDGSADEADPDCGLGGGSEYSAPECADGYNNDGDIWPDWPLDPQCESPYGTSET